MSFLTGSEIKRRKLLGEIDISPYDPELIQPNSYDVTLANTVRTYEDVYYLDPTRDNPTKEWTIPPDGMILRPGVLYIASTVEYIRCGNLLPLLDGKSSLGRLGLVIHHTAGLGDVGFEGAFTLEMAVVYPIKLYAGMRIGQLRFAEVVGEIQRYAGRYQGQRGPTPSRMHLPAPTPEGQP